MGSTIAIRKRLISNFVALLVLRGFNFLIPLITLPYLVRVIGLENFGLVNFSLSLGLYFGAIIQFGFGVTATREIARNRDDSIKLAQIYSTTLTASILLAIVSAILFTLIVLSSSASNLPTSSSPDVSLIVITSPNLYAGSINIMSPSVHSSYRGRPYVGLIVHTLLHTYRVI